MSKSQVFAVATEGGNKMTPKRIDGRSITASNSGEGGEPGDATGAREQGDVDRRSSVRRG